MSMRVPEGSIVPLPTPFTGEDARIDEAALRGIVEFQLENGSHGLSCCGTTGEPSSLSVDERKRVVEIVKAAAEFVEISDLGKLGLPIGGFLAEVISGQRLEGLLHLVNLDYHRAQPLHFAVVF